MEEPKVIGTLTLRPVLKARFDLFRVFGRLLKWGSDIATQESRSLGAPAEEDGSPALMLYPRLLACPSREEGDLLGESLRLLHNSTYIEVQN